MGQMEDLAYRSSSQLGRSLLFSDGPGLAAESSRAPDPAQAWLLSGCLFGFGFGRSQGYVLAKVDAGCLVGPGGGLEQRCSLGPAAERRGDG